MCSFGQHLPFVHGWWNTFRVADDPGALHTNEVGYTLNANIQDTLALEQDVAK